MATKEKKILPSSIDASVICPQINQDRVMYATCDCNIPALEGFQKARLPSYDTGGKLTLKIFDLADGKDKVIKEIQWEEGIIDGWSFVGNNIAYNLSITKGGDFSHTWQKTKEIDTLTRDEKVVWSNDF